MTQFKRTHLVTAAKIAGILLFLFGVYVAARFIPSVSAFFNSASRYLLLLGSCVALVFLAILAMYRMFKERDWNSLGKAAFGFVGGIILGLIVGDPAARSELASNFFKGQPGPMIYLSCFVFGVIVSEVGTLTRRTGHPILVFLCSSVGWILITLLSLGENVVDHTWLLIFLFGISMDQLLRFQSVSSPKTRRRMSGDNYE